MGPFHVSICDECAQPVHHALGLMDFLVRLRLRLEKE